MENNDHPVAPLITLSAVAPSVTSLDSLEDNHEENHLDTRRPSHKFQGRESLLSSQISLFIKETKPNIPDGGWGWLVVLAAFIINMASDGVCFTFGLLYIEFLQEFGASSSATSWIGSLFMAVPLIAGPIMSALVDKYGCRSMTMIGAFISAVGFVIASYSRSIAVMYITFGVIGGLGLGLCYVTAVVAIAFWFEKKRTVALGLGACGTGFGTFLFSPLSTYLIAEYTWRGTVLLLAGIFLNLCVCGALMRDPDWIIQQEEEEDRKKPKKGGSRVNSGRDSLNLDELKKSLERGEHPEYLLQQLDTSTDSTDKDKERFRSVVNLPTYLRRNESIPFEVIEQLSGNKHLYNVILENYPSLLVSRSSSEKGLNKLSENGSRVYSRVPVNVTMKVKKRDSPKPVMRENSIREEPEIPKPQVRKNFIFQESDQTPQQLASTVNHTGNFISSPLHHNPSPGIRRQFSTHSYLKNMRFRRNSIMYRGAMLNINKYRLRAASCPDMFKNSMTTLAKESEEKWYTEFLEVLKDISHFSLFLELHFFLMSLSTICLFTWFIVPYFYLADHMGKCGYSDTEASFVISVIGVTNTIGMVALGWAGDRPWMNVTKSYAICLILCGICCSAMLFFASNYIVLNIFAGLFGIFFASSFSFTPAILAELVPLDAFTMGYGLILLCQGIGNLVGPPLAGLLFDQTKSWDQSFYQAGIWIIVSGILVGLIPYTTNRKIIGTGPVIMDSVNDKSSVA